jgi:hypothetical protein
VQEQLSPAKRLVLRVAAVAVRADVNVEDEDLAVLDARGSCRAGSRVLANGFYLGADETMPASKASRMW